MSRLALALLGVSLVSVGCQGPAPFHDPETSHLQPHEISSNTPPTTNPETVMSDEVGMEGLLVGTLEGDPDRNCAWVSPVGAPDDPVSVVWPSYVEVRSNPLRLVDTRNNQVVARVGDRVKVTGGTSPDAPSNKPRCQVGANIWIAYSIAK